jgi:hypothetical protein
MRMRDEQLAELLAEALAREYDANGQGMEVHTFEMNGYTIRVTVKRVEGVEWAWNQAQVSLQSSG